MRITGGTLRSRRVQVPQGQIRPSMDQMRESVFACLGDLCGRSFLDLFSGSGIIAIEAASRGAAYIEAVENDQLKRKILLQNVAISPVRISCHFISAELYVQRAKRAFDIIFIDPPFPYQYKWELLSRIASSPLISNESILLVHRPKEDPPSENFIGNRLIHADSREFGRSVVDFFRANTEL